jgi:hypothetical protein
VPEVLGDVSNGLTGYGRELFAELYEELCELDERLGEHERRISCGAAIMSCVSVWCRSRALAQ